MQVMLVSELEAGLAVRLEDRSYKILEVVRHAGSGQMHGFIELKLKDLQFGHFADRHFKQTDKVEMVELSKREMEYLYHDDEKFYFMDPRSYDQVSIPRSSIGMIERFLKEGDSMPVELLGEEAVGIQFPRIVELKVTLTGPSTHAAQDNTLKTATLENGMEILVPQFIVTGDVVRVDTEKGRYVERHSGKKL